MKTKVDIVVLTINNLADTKEFVDHLYMNSAREQFKLIFVDQGSNDGTKQFLQDLMIKEDNVVVHLSQRNLGFAGGCNLGATLGNSELILFINNDALIAPSSVDHLIESMQKHGFDAVGPISNETGEIQRYWKDYNTKNYQLELVRKNEELWRKFGNKVAEFHRIAGFCMLVSRDAFKAVDGFSEDYGVGYYEDDDLCYRLRKAGYKLGVACGVFVHHHGSRSFKHAKLSSNLLMAKNRYLFLGKTFYQISSNNDCVESPLVSVIICTYNRPQFLPRAIHSVLTQSYNNFELLIVRDGGVDVKNEVDNFKDERIKYISLEDNVGKAAALNIGLDEAHGEYIAYLDDDDFYFPNHLEVLTKIIQLTGVDFAYSDSEERTIDERGQFQTDFKSGNEFNIQRLEITNFIPNLAILHKNRVEYRYDETLKVLEDWDFLRRVAIEFGAEFVHVPVLTNVYFVRVNGQSRNGIMKLNRKLYMETFGEISQRGVWWITCPESSEALRYRSWMILNPSYRMEWLKKGLESNPWNVLAQVDLADQYVKYGNYKDASPILERSPVSYPENFQKVSLLMEIEISQGNLGNARELGGLALLLAPDKQSIITIYEKLSRANAGYDNLTSRLCYYKLTTLRSHDENDSVSKEMIKTLIIKIIHKYKSEGIRGIVSAIRKRI